MWFIGRLIKREIISPAQWRWIELFIISTLAAFGVGLLDNLDIIINWGIVDRTAFFASFVAWIALSITAAMRKNLRDSKAEADEEMM